MWSFAAFVARAYLTACFLPVLSAWLEEWHRLTLTAWLQQRHRAARVLSTRALHHGGLQAFSEVSGAIFKGPPIFSVVCRFPELGHSQLGQ